MAFGKGRHLHLIDGSAFIFRAYHALPPLTRKSDGLPIGAVAGFCNMLQRYVEGQRRRRCATHVAVIFDKGSHTFRNDMYDLYKANREAMPEDLRPQIPLTRRGDRGVQHRLQGARGLRGRRHHRHPVLSGARGGRAGHDHQFRQGPDAAGRRRGRDARRDEEPADRPRRRVREVRRLSRARGGRAGAGGGFGRQRAGRAGDRDQDGGAADQRIRLARRRFWTARTRSSSPSGARR